jgi:hypothetical protein
VGVTPSRSAGLRERRRLAGISSRSTLYNICFDSLLAAGAYVLILFWLPEHMF